MAYRPRYQARPYTGFGGFNWGNIFGGIGAAVGGFFFGRQRQRGVAPPPTGNPEIDAINAEIAAIEQIEQKLDSIESGLSSVEHQVLGPPSADFSDVQSGVSSTAKTVNEAAFDNAIDLVTAGTLVGGAGTGESIRQALEVVEAKILGVEKLPPGGPEYFGGPGGPPLPKGEQNMGWGDPILEAASVAQGLGGIIKTVQQAVSTIGGSSVATTTTGRIINVATRGGFTMRIYRWIRPYLLNIGVIAATMTAAEALNAAFNWWLGNGQPRPRPRHMNPLNPKALRRATRRLASFNNFAKDTQRELARLAPPRRRSAGSSYCGTCRKNPCGC